MSSLILALVNSNYMLFWNVALQLHWEAWVRFGVVSGLAVLVYALYGQYNATTDISMSEHSPLYYKAPTVDIDA